MSYNRGRGFGFGGFSFAKKQEAIPPPPNAALSKHGYHTMTAISQNAISGGCGYGQPRKRPRDEDEYFDDEDESFEGAYQPAPGSPGPQRKESSDSDEDPLDAFMAGIEQEVKRTKVKGSEDKKEMKGVRDDIDEEDDEESYYRYIQENPNAGRQQEDSEDEIEYDEDGNPIAPKKPKYIDPLPPIDHSTIQYAEFTKNFYQEHEDIAALGPGQMHELRTKLGIKVTGFDAPKPVTSFGHFGFDEALMKSIRKSEYTQPTPIQAQAVPIALSGRDAIGIAKTGSGKTAAFIWPMLVHIMDQRELSPGEGPIGLILAPTRELAQQIYTEARRFGKVYNIQVVCAYGGGSKWEQSKGLEAGAEIVVATPGRMIDMIKMKATNLQRVTFLVLDEADRMFDMGFEPQVRSICDHVRPDRQTLLFSATFKRKVERLARDVLTDPVRVVQGELGEANQDVTQIIKLLNSSNHKWLWLTKHLVEFMSEGSVLIFVTKKANAEELCNSLTTKEYDALLLHGDMSQYERNEVITGFKRKDKPILVATDVAARGLDIPHIRTVVNYDVARDIDTHTHRIGRTGRAGEKGTAYTLVTDKDKEFAGHLVRNLEGAAQEVPKELMELAMQSSWFRKSRFKQGKAKALGGRGLGFRERPGLGSNPVSETTTGTVLSSSTNPSTTAATTTTTAPSTTATLTTTAPSTTTTATTVTTQPSVTTTTTMTVTTPPCTSASPTVPVLPTQTSTTTITTSTTTTTITTTTPTPTITTITTTTTSTTSLVSASKNAKPVHVPSHRHHTTATSTTTTTAITTAAAAVTQEPESDGPVRGKAGRGRARQEGRGQEEEPPTRRRSGRATTLASTRATESDLQEIEELRRSRRAKRAAVALAKEEGWSSSSEAPLSPQMSPDTLRGWPPPRLTSPTPSQSSEGTTSSTPSQRSNRLSSRSRRQSPASTFDFSMSASRSSAPSTPASQSSLGTGGASGSLADKSLADPNAGYTCDNSLLTRAPSFFPSEEEFTDPLDYIEKIRPEAEQFGLCRIVPPSNFKPECRVNDDMRFTGNNQYIQKMMHRWGPNVRTLRAIRRCLAKQNIELTTNPLIGCMELDLVRLYEVVEQHGGLMSVIENELWGKVADACRIPRSAQERITKLDSIYCKYLLPYATLSTKEREELLAEVDAIHARNMGESGAKKPSSTASSDNEEEEEEESLDCIVKGKSTALSTFYRIARNTASQWQPDPAGLEVDERYWSLVSNGSHHVCVLSASIDTSEHGYGFPSHRSSPLAKHPWNLKNLCQNPNSILKSMGTIVGVTAPTLHVGMLFSTVCWYKDPHSLPWIEYLHTGASKIWYGVAASQEGKLCAALKKMVPDFVKDSAIWLPSDTAMVPPSELVREGVRVCRVVQDPGQFVVVFPGAFTSSVCKGYLISESAFFARPQYFDRAVATFKALRDCCEPSMFSLERLVLSVVTDPRSTLDGLLRARELVLQVVQREKDLRARLAQIGLEASERLSTPDSHRKKKSRFIEDEEENMCEMCRQNLYVALVTNSQEEAVYCLEHALTFLNKNPDHLEYCKLMYTYSLSELDGAVKQMEERIQLKSGKKTSPIGKKGRQREHLDSFSSTSSSNL